MNMNFEKIEQAYHLLLENVQALQNHLSTNFYDALIEQNSLYLEETPPVDFIKTNNQALKELNLSQEEWRRSFQFLLMKAAQTEPLQANHQFTPDSISFLLVYLIDQLFEQDKIELVELGSGTGNLAETLLIYSQKELDYLGLEVDDLLIDLSASMAEVMNSPARFAQGDAIRPQIIKESDLVLSDLPLGYYPYDQVAQRFAVRAEKEHTYAHHLLIEQGLKYIHQEGYAIFLAPNDLLTSPQSDYLKKWMQEKAHLAALISLPLDLFAAESQAKSIFIFQKSPRQTKESFLHVLTDLKDKDQMIAFRESFEKWNNNK